MDGHVRLIVIDFMKKTVPYAALFDPSGEWQITVLRFYTNNNNTKILPKV